MSSENAALAILIAGIISLFTHMIVYVKGGMDAERDIRHKFSKWLEDNFLALSTRQPCDVVGLQKIMRGSDGEER